MINNTALQYGGAIKLATFIYLDSHAELHLINNTALYGGGIAVTTDYSSDNPCLIQVETRRMPWHYTVKIKVLICMFQNSTLGAAVVSVVTLVYNQGFNGYAGSHNKMRTTNCHVENQFLGKKILWKPWLSTKVAMETGATVAPQAGCYSGTCE